MDDLPKLITYLESKGFQNPQTGNLFFPAYIYTYEREEEYAMRKEILKIEQRLQRPTQFLESLRLNLYKEFIEYLKANKFGKFTYFEQIKKQENRNPQRANNRLMNEVDSPDFYAFIQKKVKQHFIAPKEKKVYLLIHGIGEMYPYLRASTFLKRTEAWIKDFKVIVFYPGEYTEHNYSLFKELKNDNIYRVNLLNQMI